MYIRFVITEVDHDSNRRQGILVAAHALRDRNVLESHEQKALSELCKWFNEHLKVPEVLEDPEHYRAISWFKGDAEKPIGQAWQLVHLLRNQGYLVDVIKTDAPGSILYEDKWQVAAKPPKGKKLGW